MTVGADFRAARDSLTAVYAAGTTDAEHDGDETADAEHGNEHGPNTKRGNNREDGSFNAHVWIIHGAAPMSLTLIATDMLRYQGAGLPSGYPFAFFYDYDVTSVGDGLTALGALYDDSVATSYFTMIQEHSSTFQMRGPSFALGGFTNSFVPEVGKRYRILCEWKSATVRTIHVLRAEDASYATDSQAGTINFPTGLDTLALNDDTTRAGRGNYHQAALLFGQTLTADQVNMLLGRGDYQGAPRSADNIGFAGTVVYQPLTRHINDVVQPWTFEALRSGGAFTPTLLEHPTDIVYPRVATTAAALQGTGVLSTRGNVTPSAAYLTALDPTSNYRTGAALADSNQTVSMLRHGRCTMATSVTDKDTGGNTIVGGLNIQGANARWQVGKDSTGQFWRRPIGANPGTGWTLCSTTTFAGGQFYIFRGDTDAWIWNEPGTGNWQRSTDLGATWSAIAAPPAYSEAATYSNWTFDSDASGNGCLIEYDDNSLGDRGGGHKVSITHDYGVTWNLVLDARTGQTNEIKVVKITGDPGSGTWDYGSATGIAIGATASAVETAIETAIGAGTVSVVRTGTTPNFIYSIEYDGPRSGFTAVVVADDFDQGAATIYQDGSEGSVQGTSLWKHIHHVRWHNQRNKFIATTGDGQARQYAWLIDPVTEAVTAIHEPADLKANQWVWSEEIDGNPDVILCGSDEYKEVYAVDLDTGDATRLTKICPGLPNAAFVWFMFKHAGVYYAWTTREGAGSGGDTLWTNGVSEILASLDPLNGPWTVVYRTPRNLFNRGWIYGGLAEGALHFEIVNYVGPTFQHWAFTPPSRFEVLSGQLCLPQRYEFIHQATTGSGPAEALGDAVQGTDTGIDGGTVRKFTIPDDAGTSGFSTGSNALVAAGDQLQAACFVKGTLRRPWLVNGSQAGDQMGDRVLENDADQWTRFETLAWRQRSGGGHAVLSAVELAAAIDYDIIADKISIQRAPITPYHAALTNRRAATVSLAYEVPASAQWAALTCVSPTFNWWQLAHTWGNVVTEEQFVAQVRSVEDPTVKANLFWRAGVETLVNGSPSGSDPNLTLTLEDDFSDMLIDDPSVLVGCWVTWDRAATTNAGSQGKITAVDDTTPGSNTITITNPSGAAFSGSAPVDNSRLGIVCPQFMLVGYDVDGTTREVAQLFGVDAIINKDSAFEAVIWLDANGDLNCTIKNAHTVNTLGPLTTIDVSPLATGNIEVLRGDDWQNGILMPAAYHQDALYDSEDWDADDIADLFDQFGAPSGLEGGIKFISTNADRVYGGFTFGGFVDVFQSTVPFFIANLPASEQTILFCGDESETDDQFFEFVVKANGLVVARVADSDTGEDPAELEIGTAQAGKTNILTFAADFGGPGSTQRFRGKLNGGDIETLNTGLASGSHYAITNFASNAGVFGGRKNAASDQQSFDGIVQSPFYTSEVDTTDDAFDNHDRIWNTGDPIDPVDLDPVPWPDTLGASFSYTFRGPFGIAVQVGDPGLATQVADGQGDDPFDFLDGMPIYDIDIFDLTAVMVVTPLAGFSASGIEGDISTGATPASKVYRIRNAGNTVLPWSSTDDVTWLSYSTTSGSIGVGSFVDVTVTFNALADALAAGTHNATITFLNTENGQGNTTRAVSLEVIEAPAGSVIVTSDNPITFIGIENKEASFIPQTGTTINVFNDTSGTIEIQTIYVLASWFDLLTGASVPYELADQADIDFTVDLAEGVAASLEPGLYSGSITIRDATNEVTVAILDVVLTVTDARHHRAALLLRRVG